MAETKPTKIPRWADDDLNVTEPSEAKKDLGWIVDDVPPSSYENWKAKLIGEWMTWLNERLADGSDENYLDILRPDNQNTAISIGNDYTTINGNVDISTEAGHILLADTVLYNNVTCLKMKNREGGTITAGQCVCSRSGGGDDILACNFDNTAFSLYLCGIAMETIADDAFGLIAVSGVIESIIKTGTINEVGDHVGQSTTDGLLQATQTPETDWAIGQIIGSSSVGADRYWIRLYR